MNQQHLQAAALLSHFGLQMPSALQHATWRKLSAM
jgi:hypothetical protein